MKIRIYIKTYHTANMPIYQRYDGINVEYGHSSSSQSRIKLVKELYSDALDWARYIKANANGGYGNDIYNNLINESVYRRARLKIFNRSKPWRTFRFGNNTVEVRLYRQPI